ALVASFFVPLVLLALLLKLLPALAAPLVGRERANSATVFLLFAPLTLFNFTPGRVDHHNWEILIAGFGILGLGHLSSENFGWRFAVPLALSFACGLWIGTEALPWLILCLGCLAFAGAWYGGYVLRNGAVFGVALAMIVAAIFPLAIAREQYSDLALSWFSLADVIFACLAGGVLGLAWFFGRLMARRALRLLLVSALGLIACALFFRLVPEAAKGPFADFDGFNSTVSLENIGEAVPLASVLKVHFYNHLTYLRALMAFLRFLLLPVLGLTVVIYNVLRGQAAQRMLWVFHGVFLLAATLLAFLWQSRAGWFMEMFAIAPLTWLAVTGWQRIKERFAGKARVFAGLGAFLLLAPLPVLLLPAAVNGTAFYPNILLFPAARPLTTACPLTAAASYIAGPWGYIDRPYMILAAADDGPELLFRTRDNVIAANFNVPGNRDVFDFFNARDDEVALNVLRKWHVDLVLTCRTIAPFYAGLDHPKFGANVFLLNGADGKLHLGGDPDHRALLEKLINGQTPDWLQPVEIPNVKDYLLYEVKLPETHGADQDKPRQPGKSS
nr:hypothetical protein [Pseudomonadota bacterium]